MERESDLEKIGRLAVEARKARLEYMRHANYDDTSALLAMHHTIHDRDALIDAYLKAQEEEGDR